MIPRRTTGGRPKQRLAPSYEPWPCVLITVDTAERSGWAITVRGKSVEWGEVDMLRPERSTWLPAAAICPVATASSVCALAALLGAQHKLPLVLVYELPFGGQYQGGWSGSWKAAFMAAGGVKSRMRGVQASCWRARVTGLGQATRDVARRGDMARAQREVAAIHGAADWTKVELGGDEAAALCMAVYARHAGEVGKLLPKPKAPRAPKAERPRCLSQPKPRKPKAPAQAEVV